MERKSGMPIDKQGILDDIFPELAKSGEEDKELSHKEVTKKSDKVWSEEDEIILNGIIDDFGDGKTSNMLQELWLKSIKDRMQ